MSTQIAYLGTMFIIRYHQHQNELLETERPKEASYQVMIAASTETATLVTV